MGLNRTPLWCCGCGKDVSPRLTNGAEIYAHRADLSNIPFWRCDACGNFVGCHHKTDTPTRPLGVIPTKELRAARRRVHEVVDPLWKNGPMKRSTVYARIAEHMGWRRYHTGDLRSVEHARRVCEYAETLKTPIAEEEAS